MSERHGAMRILAAAAAALLVLGGGPGEARETRPVDVLVVDLGLRSPSEEALRVRTLLQVLAPGIEVKRLHYRRLTAGRIQAIAPRALVLAPTRDAWARYPSKNLELIEQAVRAFRRPLLAIGSGHQLLARAWGGELREMPGSEGEFGETTVHVVQEDPLLRGLAGDFVVSQGHHEEVASLPEGFVLLVAGDQSRIQAMRHETRPIYGLQFHPEDPRGARLPARQILRNFLELAHVVRER